MKEVDCKVMRIAQLASLILLVGPTLSAQAPSLDQLETRAREDSLDAEAHFRLATRYYTLKRFDDEERELRVTIAIDPRYAPAYLWLGYLPFDRKRSLWKDYRKGRVPRELVSGVEESERLWRQAFLVDPLVDFRVIGAEPPTEEMVVVPEYGRATTDYLLGLGLGAFGAARYELAHSALTTWAERAYHNQPLDSLPDFLFWYRGLAYAHLRAWNRAAEDIQTLLRRSLRAERADTLIQIPLHTSDYQYLLGVLYQAWRKPADATRLYQDALAGDLGLYMAHVRLAQLRRESKMWGEAIEEARRATAANPDDPTALLELGIILSEAGRSAEAEETLHQASSANPRDPRPAYHLGVLEVQLGKPAEARESLAQFVARAPQSRYERLLADAKQRLAALSPNEGPH